MSQSQEGREVSPETRARISDSWTPRHREAQRRKNSGSGNPQWRGGRTIDGAGYVHLHRPDHARARQTGYVFEHILVAEEQLGRPLRYFGHGHRANEVVHHINGKKDDNRKENLQVMTLAEHTRHHTTTRRCRHCGELL